MLRRILFALALPATLAVLVFASDIKLEGVTCPISGQAVTASASADYKDGKVHFCCNDCPGTFKANTAKYATKANHQLVQTGQAVQSNCPISGEPIDQSKSVKVGGAEVFFCCNNCKDKVAKATGDQQMNLVFSDAAWSKAGFKVSH